MKTWSVIAFISLIFSLSLTVSGSLNSGHQSKISKEEYAVYSAVIKKMFEGDKVAFDTQAKIKMLVINDHTINSSGRADHVENQDWKYLKQFFPEVSQEMLDDFTAKNKKENKLKDDFDVQLRRTLIKKEEI